MDISLILFVFRQMGSRVVYDGKEVGMLRHVGVYRVASIGSIVIVRLRQI